MEKSSTSLNSNHTFAAEYAPASALPSVVWNFIRQSASWFFQFSIISGFILSGVNDVVHNVVR